MFSASFADKENSQGQLAWVHGWQSLAKSDAWLSLAWQGRPEKFVRKQEENPQFGHPHQTLSFQPTEVEARSDRGRMLLAILDERGLRST